MLGTVSLAVTMVNSNGNGTAVVPVPVMLVLPIPTPIAMKTLQTPVTRVSGMRVMKRTGSRSDGQSLCGISY